MRLLTLFFLLCFLAISCKNQIKNEDARVEVEAGTAVVSADTVKALTEETAEQAPEKESTQPQDGDPYNEMLGYWVGYFKQDTDDYEEASNKAIYADEAFYWNRENKINISIDNIEGEKVIGHSVVAGNDRPFEGTIEPTDEEGKYRFVVKEPGDDKYDGEFVFTCDGRVLKGKWTAYRNIDIRKRKYQLVKRTFEYDPDRMLDRSQAYIDWTKFIEEKDEVETGEDEFEGWVRREFASTTGLIYEVNASNRLIQKSEAENMKQGDLIIIRNTIYARHGYSFKNRPLRVFFDAQPWYIPVHADIKSDFTEIEKKNIQLLLKYEKNAKVYYDYFGRG
jgi:hypothetical protein